MEKDLYLVLANGKVFKGKSFGYEGEVTGEIVFTTGMVGYHDTLADKNYAGQIVVQTFPLIGNYGVIGAQLQSEKITLSGYIVKDVCREPSNFRSEGDLDSFLKAQKVIGLYGIDTRALTRILRDHGVMNGRLTFNPDSVKPGDIKKFKTEKAVESVSSAAITQIKTDGALYNVALLDMGLNQNTVRALQKCKCNITVYPCKTTAEEIIKASLGGIVLSDGPGDPTENTQIIENIKKLSAAKIPMMGIGLGHQLIALSAGLKTRKLKYGHRGANQPVKDLKSDRVYITNQNHGYEVIGDNIDIKVAEADYVNVNDGSCEGITYKNLPAFGVQFHPEVCEGPQDTMFLFDKFISMMKKK